MSATSMHPTYCLYAVLLCRSVLFVHVHTVYVLCINCRFIQKQGLDRTFVECDNHMWRVGRRPIPPDVVIDGGSDWIILHRDFVHYLVNSKDQYLTALKRYFEFTLLPAEVCL